MSANQRCGGKVVLVTGAQRGIGRAIAIRFAEAGADVALNYLDDKAAAESAAAEITALGRRATALAADIAKPEEARRLVAAAERALGPIDVHVNNAAIFPRAPFLELTPHGIRVNAVAPGVTNTAMPRLGNTEDALAAMGRTNPTGRLAEPDDIADVVVFLATDEARYVVGQLVHVNGATITVSRSSRGEVIVWSCGQGTSSANRANAKQNRQWKLK